MIQNKAITTLHEALRLQCDIFVDTCVKMSPKFDHFYFHFENYQNVFNNLANNYQSRFDVFTHNHYAHFKTDYFDLGEHPLFDEMFLKAINFKLETVDKVINAYFKAAYSMEKNGLITFIKNNSTDYIGNEKNYITFSKKWKQEYINKNCELAIFKFHNLYKTNNRSLQNASISSKLHFYIDEGIIKPVVIINTHFGPEYELNFIVDIDSGTICATRKIYAGRSYRDLMSMSRPVDETTLDDAMYRHFVDRLIPVVKKRYGVKKADMNIYDTSTREQYISLLLMEAI